MHETLSDKECSYNEYLSNCLSQLGANAKRTIGDLMKITVVLKGIIG